MTDEAYAKLSWRILEAKVRYYRFSTFTQISDSIYDQMEAEFDTECIRRGKPNHFKEMVGYGEDRPSLRLAISKVQSKGD